MIGVSLAAILAELLRQNRRRLYHRQVCDRIIAIIGIITAGENHAGHAIRQTRR